MISQHQCLFILIWICARITAILCITVEPLVKIKLNATSHIYEGDDLTLNCTAPKHVYDPSITWLIDEEILHADGEHAFSLLMFIRGKISREKAPKKRYKINNITISDTEYSSTLEVANLTKHNSGLYECRAEKTLGKPGIFDNTSLRIDVKDVIPPTMNYTTLNDKNITVMEGTYIANLTCVASGEPPPTISWYKDDKKLKHKGEKMITLKPAKSSEFKCVAENKGGKISSSIYITVESKSFLQRFKRTLIIVLVVNLVLFIIGCSYKLVQKLRRRGAGENIDECAVPMHEPIFENNTETELTKH